MKKNRLTGTIKYWNGRKGFGFIQPDDDEKQVFVHIRAFTIRKNKPLIGQVVTYVLSADDQGRSRAEDVLVDGEIAAVSEEEQENTSIISRITSLPVIIILVLVAAYIAWIYFK